MPWSRGGCLISLKQVKMKIEDIDLYEVATIGGPYIESISLSLSGPSAR